MISDFMGARRKMSPKLSLLHPLTKDSRLQGASGQERRRSLLRNTNQISLLIRVHKRLTALANNGFALAGGFALAASGMLSLLLVHGPYLHSSCLHSSRKEVIRLRGKGNSSAHGARPVHQIILMTKWIRTSRLSMNQVDSDQ